MKKFCWIYWIVVSLIALFAVIVKAVIPGGKPKAPDLALVKPQYEWVRPSIDGTELCLTGSDYIKHQMYMEGLKHEAHKN